MILNHPFLLSAAGAISVAAVSGSRTKTRLVITLVACIVSILAVYEGFEELQTIEKDDWIILRTRRRRRRPAPIGVSRVRTALWVVGALVFLLVGRKAYLYDVEAPKAAVESLVQWANGALVVQKSVGAGRGIVWIRPGSDLDECPGFALASLLASKGAVRKTCLLTQAGRAWPLFVRTVRIPPGEAFDPMLVLRDVRRIVRSEPDTILIADPTVSMQPGLAAMLILLASETQVPFYIQTTAGGRSDTRDGYAVPFTMIGMKVFQPSDSLTVRSSSMEWETYVSINRAKADTVVQEMLKEAEASAQKIRGRALNLPPQWGDERTSTGLPLELPESFSEAL